MSAQRPTQGAAQAVWLAVNELKPKIRACREEMDRDRRLPPHLVEALKMAGCFRMTMPIEWGGYELDPISQLEVIEALARADASAAWCVMIGADSGLYSGFIDQDVARDMYSDVDAVTASALTTTGRAVKTDRGYWVSGRMPFVSGCQHSSWFLLGCKVHDSSGLVRYPNGTPVTRQCFVPAESVKILDTWDSLGLRGTGSHDVVVDTFVPRERTFSFQDFNGPEQFHRQGALYSFPLNILLNFASVPLGVAQSALDSVIETGDRPSREMHVDGQVLPPRTLREESFVQDAVGRAAAKLGAARAYLYATIADIWKTLSARQMPSHVQLAEFQAVSPYVYECCTEVVESLFKVRGGSAVYRGNELERCLRDIATMNQHVVNSLRFYQAAGRVRLGLPPEQLLL